MVVVNLKSLETAADYLGFEEADIEAIDALAQHNAYWKRANNLVARLPTMDRSSLTPPMIVWMLQVKDKLEDLRRKDAL
jgi:hypothetical protein